MGGLGNQLFQHACAVGLSEKWEVPYCAPLSTLNPTIWPYYHFDGLSHCTEMDDTSFFYNELVHSFHEIPYHKNITLQGYFQSYRFFDHCEWQVRDLFHPNWRMIPNTCSVHIRRGDYLLYPTKHPVITEEYLDRAIRCMEGNFKAALYIFFTDDIEWTKKYVSGKKITYLISEGKTPLEDLRLMANCSHQIISNSTFSWWGAYLNRNKKKSVLTPHEDNWFGPDNKHLDVSDLLPPDWERIKY